MRIVVGDLWDQPRGYKVVPTNLQGVMGRGVARQARDMFPGLEADLKRRARESNPPLLVTYRMQGIVCLAVKRQWRDRADLDLIKRNLQHLAGAEWELRKGAPGGVNGLATGVEAVALPDGAVPIYLPLLGCGFGELEPIPVLKAMAATLKSDAFVLVLPPDSIAGRYPDSFKPGARIDRTVPNAAWPLAEA